MRKRRRQSKLGKLAEKPATGSCRDGGVAFRWCSFVGSLVQLAPYSWPCLSLLRGGGALSVASTERFSQVVNQSLNKITPFSIKIEHILLCLTGRHPDTVTGLGLVFNNKNGIREGIWTGRQP